MKIKRVGEINEHSITATYLLDERNRLLGLLMKRIQSSDDIELQEIFQSFLETENAYLKNQLKIDEDKTYLKTYPAGEEITENSFFFLEDLYEKYKEKGELDVNIRYISEPYHSLHKTGYKIRYRIL